MGSLRRSYSTIPGFVSIAALFVGTMMVSLAAPNAVGQSEPAAPAVAQPAPSAKVKLTGHSWKLTAIGGRDVDPAVVHPPEMTLVEDGLRIVGLTGCNRFAGTYTLQNAKISVNGELSVTRRKCPSVMDLESSFLKALQSMDSWKITSDGLLELYRDQVLLAQFKSTS